MPYRIHMGEFSKRFDFFDFSQLFKRFCPGDSKNVFVLVLAHLEPDLELFEVDAIGEDGDDDLSYHYLPNFKQLLLGF